MTIHSILLDIAHILIPIVIIIIALIPTCFFIISQQQEGLVSRLGRYTGTPKTSGLHFKIPLIDRLDAKISKALQSIHANLDTKTTDDQFVTLPISIQFNVRDCAKYYYDNINSSQQIKDIVTAQVRKYTSCKNFQHLYDERQEISESVIDGVKQELLDYGVEVIRIIIDEPQPDLHTKQAYNDVRASERRKDAAVNDAQAAYIKTTKHAEADRERNKLIGQGIKDFRKSVAESYIETRAALIQAGVHEPTADAFMAEAMRLDTLRDVGEKGNVVVIALNDTKDDHSMAKILAALKSGKKDCRALEE